MNMDARFIHIACEEKEEIPILDSEVGEIADIVECGAGLIFKESISAITAMKKRFPDKEIVADIKMTPLVAYHHGRSSFEAGADALIITGTKYKREMKPVMDIARELDKKIYVVIETEPCEVIDQKVLNMYQEIGVKHLIYHSIKKKAPFWTEEDKENIMAIGYDRFCVSITGHVGIDTILFLKGIPIYSYIIGSGIMKAEDPVSQIKEYRKMIDK